MFTTIKKIIDDVAAIKKLRIQAEQYVAAIEKIHNTGDLKWDTEEYVPITTTYNGVGIWIYWVRWSTKYGGPGWLVYIDNTEACYLNVEKTLYETKSDAIDAVKSFIRSEGLK